DDLTLVHYQNAIAHKFHNTQIVERGVAQEIYRNPKEEYTRNLIASIPTGSPERMRQNLPKTLPQLKDELLGLVQGNSATAQNLIETQKSKTPDESEEWILEKVIQDLIRDRH
ncbi:MAG: hypothetical protein AAFX80_18565, partial [Cyanobacteria bacterium J06639_18]